jgi:hypothetical protein
MFQLNQASHDLTVICKQFSDQKTQLQQQIASAKSVFAKGRAKALTRMKSDAYISGMPVQSLNPADYGFKALSPIVPQDQAAIAEIDKLLRVCHSALPLLNDGIKRAGKTVEASTDTGRRAHEEHQTPLTRAEQKLAAAQQHMKIINLPLKASILLKTSNAVLGLFADGTLPANGRFRRLSAVRATLDSAVVMATELSQITRKLVLQVWTLQSQVKKAQQSMAAKVLSVAIDKGSQFPALQAEYVSEKAVLKNVLRKCKNMTGVLFMIS